MICNLYIYIYKSYNWLTYKKQNLLTSKHAKLLNAKWLKADKVKKDFNDLGFSI